MNPTVLHRIDPARRMARFYRLELQPDLFGEWNLICEWGRIGRGGRIRSAPFPTWNAAELARARQQIIKEKRGYHKARGTL